jgi:hypothetical protein
MQVPVLIAGGGGGVGRGKRNRRKKNTTKKKHLSPCCFMATPRDQLKAAIEGLLVKV